MACMFVPTISVYGAETDSCAEEEIISGPEEEMAMQEDVIAEVREYEADPDERLHDPVYSYIKPYLDAIYQLKYHVMEDDTICIDGYDGSAGGALFIPDMILEKYVTVIGADAFNGSDSDQFTGDLIIPDHVKEIGARAFLGCYGLDGKLQIGDSVEVIGDAAFKSCGSLQGNLIIPDNVTKIGLLSFAMCGFNGKLILSNSLTEIPENAFFECRSLQGDLTIPGNIAIIGDHAFESCEGFKGNLYLGNSVETIGYRAFYGHQFSGDLILPDSLQKIGGQAFGLCGFSGDLIIPDSVKEIGAEAFMSCSGFDGNLLIGNGVISIGRDVFYNCRGLQKNMTIGKSVTTIGISSIPAALPNFRMITSLSDTVINLRNVANESISWIDVSTGEHITELCHGTAIREEAYQPSDSDEFTHAYVGNRTYTGFPIIPDIKVYDGNVCLQEKIDYTISYKNNTNAGSATFTITGKGNYTGKETDTFRIVAKTISDEDVSFSDLATVKEGKKPYMPVPVITYNGKKLIKDKDFTVSYYHKKTDAEESKDHNTPVVTPQKSGTYYARIDGIRNFCGYKICTFKITRNDEIPVSDLQIEKIADQDYKGGQWTPEPVVRYGETVLESGKDYELSYGANTEPGTGTVTITGNYPYVGRRTLTFQIKGTIPMNKVTIEGFQPSLVYNGKEQEQILTLYYKTGATQVDVPYAEKEAYESMSDAKKATIKCIATYTDHKNAGKVTMTLTGIHGCTGSVKKTYQITPFDLFSAGDDHVYIEMIFPPYRYAKAGTMAKPAIMFKSGLAWDNLQEGVDYTLSWRNNKKVFTGDLNESGAPQVIITGKGNFKGKKTKSFQIDPANMSDSASGIKVVVNDMIYAEKEGNFKPKKITLIDKDGKALKAGTDYDLNTAVFRKGSEDGEVLSGNEILPAGSLIHVSVSAKDNSKCYTGVAKGTYRIAKFDIGKLSLENITKTYTGKPVTLTEDDLIWKDKGKRVNDVTFEIVESTYQNNTNKGKATVTIRGTGENYCGTKTITFGIGVRKIFWWWL